MAPPERQPSVTLLKAAAHMQDNGPPECPPTSGGLPPIFFPRSFTNALVRAHQ